MHYLSTNQERERERGLSSVLLYNKNKKETLDGIYTYVPLKSLTALEKVEIITRFDFFDAVLYPFSLSHSLVFVLYHQDLLHLRAV